jgi:hypothetical protein
VRIVAAAAAVICGYLLIFGSAEENYTRRSRIDEESFSLLLFLPSPSFTSTVHILRIAELSISDNFRFLLHFSALSFLKRTKWWFEC